MIIEHLALRSDWLAAQQAGAYQVSTRGRTLGQEGFIHASRPEQTADVRRRYYDDVEANDLVLLVIDTDLLDVPWRLDPVGDTDFPHLYGPLAPGAVVEVRDVAAS